MMTPDMMERQKLTAEGMAQFELMHAPIKAETRLPGEQESRELVVCQTCKQDFPCNRMATMLIVQGMATLTAMIPSGNMGAILGRFSGGR